MLHSLHVIGSRRLGGAENFFQRLLDGMHGRGLRVAAVTRPQSPIRGLLNEDLRQFPVAMQNNWDYFSSMAIRRLIEKLAPVFVQTYMGRASRLTRLPAGSATIHIARLGGYYKIRGYYDSAHAWVANTRGLRDYLVEQGLRAERIYCIGNFVDPPEQTDSIELARLRSRYQIPADALVVFALGRFVRKKGFSDLLDAFSLLDRQIHGRPLFLVIAGDGPLRGELIAAAEGLAVSGRIRWVGWKTRPTPFFHLADVCVCPSRHEPLGNVILEAWAHRAPVVSTDTAGGRELICHEANGLLVPVERPDRLAAAIREVLAASPRSRSRLVRNGCETLVRGHSKDAVLEGYLAMYEDLERKIGRMRRERKACGA